MRYLHRFENFEGEVESLQKIMANDSFYKQEQDQIKKIQDQLQVAENNLSHCYTRWEELEQ